MWHKIKNKSILLIVVIVIVGGIVYFATRKTSSDSGMEFQYEPLAVGDVVKSISATGKLDLFETASITSSINGMAVQVLADFNQQVRAGDLLAVLDSPEVDANLANMKENFKRATIELESVKDFYESKQKLFEDQLVSQKEVDDSRRNYEKAISMYNQSKLSYDAALSSSNAKRIYAPISGIILQREIDPKVPVPAGKLLFVIAPDMKRMKLIVNVDESDIGFVKTGLTVEFTVSAYPDKVFSGKITQVRMNPIVIPVGQGSRMVTYESLVECANPQMLLRPGMSATALVNIDRKSNVLRIPNAAFMIAPMPVESEIGKKYVWKKERLSVKAIPMKRVEVKTGLIGDDFTEFQGKDLSEGDEVLVGMHKKFELKGL